MFKRKNLVLAIILLAVPGLLFSGGGSQASQGASQGFARTGYPIVPEKITVRCLITGTLNMDNPRVLWQELEKLTNINVDFFTVETAQVPTFMAAGNWPDFFHHNLPAAYIFDYGILGNRFVDYNTMLPIMPHLEECFRMYPLARKIMTESNGAIYQLPTFALEVTSSTVRFYYRKDNLQRHNLPVPRTLDEYYNTLVALRNATGTAPMEYDMATMENWFFPSFGEFIEPGFDSNAQGQVVFNRTSEQYRRFLTYINRLYREGLLHQEFLTLDTATRLAIARQGIATFTGTQLQNASLSDFPSGNWDIGVPRPFTSQWNSATKVKRNPTERPGGFAINARSRYTNEVARLLDIGFALTEVSPGTGLYGDAFCYGPEGLTWMFTNPQRTEFDFIMPPGETKTPSVYQYENVIYGNQGMPRALSNAITAEISNNRIRQIEFLENLNPFTVTDFFPLTSLKFTEDEQTVIDNRFTDIRTYVEEMRAKFITGVDDINAGWDEYVRTINAMGIADVIRVHQAAYDRWNQL